MFRVKTRSPLTESKKKKCEAMTGSLPRKMQLQRVSVLCWYQTQVAQLTATHLNRWAMGSCRSTEKNGILLKVFRNLQPLFCVQHCRSWIVQAEYQAELIDSESIQNHVRHRIQALSRCGWQCAPPSEVTVQFYSNLSRRTFLGQVVSLDLLLSSFAQDSIRNIRFWSYHIFTQSPINHCRRLGNALCLCSLVLPAQAVPERGCPKSVAIDFAAITFDCLLE